VRARDVDRFTDVRPDMTIAREEIFGPILSVIRCGGLAEYTETKHITWLD
jgi:acyl-CoA reductase-like NAD-dependent aldehyde dehydrogenase